MHAYCPQRQEKGRELQVIVSHHVDTWYQTQVPWKSNKTPDYRAISPAPLNAGR